MQAALGLLIDGLAKQKISHNKYTDAPNMKSPKLLQTIRASALQLARRDRVAAPSGWNLLASGACSCVSLLWACAVGYYAWGVWAGHSFFYKGHEYVGAQAPLQASLMMLGGLGLVPFSIWTSVQYALEWVWRVRRWRGRAAWPDGADAPAAARVGPHVDKHGEL